MKEDKIQENRRNQEEMAVAQQSNVLGVAYLDLRPYEKDISLLHGVIDIPTMRKNFIVPLVSGNEGRPWQFGITTQTPQSFIRDLTKEYNESAKNINFSLISQSGLKVLLDRYDPVVKIVHDDIQIAKEGDSDTLEDVSRTLNSVGSDEIFDYLINQADRLGASDIHIENQRTNIRIRMRIDGMLHPVANLETDRYRVILAALATRANISTASNESQSGHIQKEIVNNDGVKHLLNMRVEAIPTMYGQDAVIRLFNFDESMLNLDRLGISQKERSEIDSIVSHPRGMVLIVGPTGSGKSTTLYSMLNALNKPSRKIITLEDPIEYGISGISQIPVNTTAGQSFGDELRSVLRLDPDVLMIGEIRDADTAKTAIQASITGHLVLSSFHANSTSSAFSRMLDLIGVNPIFSSAIRLVVAQRLVRRLDDSSKQEFIPDEATKKWMKDALVGLPAHIQMPDIDNVVLYKPVASEKSPFGFSGRFVIMEQMIVNEKIQKFIKGEELNADAGSIEKIARESGMVTLLQQGVLAAIRGETTLDEIYRVI